MNIQSILLLLAVLGLTAFALRHYITIGRKRGGCGCSSCDGCAQGGCALAAGKHSEHCPSEAPAAVDKA